jgi:hypothetical protein
VPPLFVEPERKYLLHVRPVGKRGEKLKKEKTTKGSRRRTR